MQSCRDKSPCYCQKILVFILHIAVFYITVTPRELQAGQRTHARQLAPQTTENLFFNYTSPCYL